MKSRQPKNAPNAEEAYDANNDARRRLLYGFNEWSSACGFFGHQNQMSDGASKYEHTMNG